MVDAVQVGTPLRRARTLPAVPALVVARAPAPLPYSSAPVVKLAQPVPPPVTARMPPIEDWVRQFPPTAKQPAVMLKPFEAVVEPVFEIEKRVVVAKLLVVEAMVKTTPGFGEVVAEVKMERRPNGLVVPMPSLPALVIVVVPVAPNEAAFDERTLVKSVVPVAFTNVRVPLKMFDPVKVLVVYVFGIVVDAFT